MSVVSPQLAALVKDNVKLKRMCSRNGIDSKKLQACDVFSFENMNNTNFSLYYGNYHVLDVAIETYSTHIKETSNTWRIKRDT